MLRNKLTCTGVQVWYRQLMLPNTIVVMTTINTFCFLFQYTAHNLLRIETVHKHNGTKMCFNWSQNYKNKAAYFINEFFITDEATQGCKLVIPAFCTFYGNETIFQSPISMTGDCRGWLSSQCKSP